MEIPEKIKEFIERRIEFEAFSLPQFYPESKSVETFQTGYKIHGLTGESLTGEKEGDFKESWYVICSNYSSDPFIVDFLEEDKGFPVYFAFHGCGSWTPIKITETIESFSCYITEIKEIEKNKAEILNYLEHNFDLNNEFWKDVHDEFLNKEESTNRSIIDDPEWIKGRIIITSTGKNKLKVINYLKVQLNLTLQQALVLSKQSEIEYKEGYLTHLKQFITHLESLGATAIFRPD